MTAYSISINIASEKNKPNLKIPILSVRSGEFATLVDSVVYLPEEWTEDEQRREEAKISEEVEFRTKQQIALEEIDRAMENGIGLNWETFDSLYGRDSSFLEGLDERELRYCGEIPCDLNGWLERPEVVQNSSEWPSRQGKEPAPDNFPRVHPDEPESQRVDELIQRLEDEDPSRWQAVHIKDTTRGPMVREVMVLEFYPKRDEVPADSVHTLIAVKDPEGEEDRTYLLSNGPPSDWQTQLHVAYTRDTIEQGFRKSKQEIGLDEFEMQKYPAVKRHLLISLLSHFLLTRKHQGLKKNSPDQQTPGGSGHQCLPEITVDEPGRSANLHPTNSGADQ